MNHFAGTTTQEDLCQRQCSMSLEGNTGLGSGIGLGSKLGVTRYYHEAWSTLPDLNFLGLSFPICKIRIMETVLESLVCCEG